MQIQPAGPLSEAESYFHPMEHHWTTLLSNKPRVSLEFRKKRSQLHRLERSPFPGQKIPTRHSFCIWRGTKKVVLHCCLLYCTLNYGID